jgi:L-glutamine-phosphate cytidylyltransferase
VTQRPGSRAIILAAGAGRRLGALTTHRPKCLLPLGNETILERQLRLLSSAGIRDVVVVVGFARDRIAAAIGNAATLCHNPEFRTTGSIHSLQVSADFLEGDVVVLNSDLVFTTPMLTELCALDRPCAVSLYPWQRSTANVGTVLSGNAVLDIGRHIAPGDSTAVFSGAARVRADAVHLFKKAVLQCDPRRTKLGWSSAFAAMIRDGCPVSACVHEAPVFDVNSVARYAAARAFVAAEAGVTANTR